MRSLNFILIALVLFTGCIPKYYKYDGHSGYTDIAMGNNTYQIEYVEKGKHGELENKKKCIIRAAELGKIKKYLYFSVIEDDTRIISNDVYVEGKTVLEKTLNEDGNETEVLTHTPSHYKEDYKTVTQITVKFRHEEDPFTLAVQDVLANAVEEGYLKEIK